MLCKNSAHPKLLRAKIWFIIIVFLILKKERKVKYVMNWEALIQNFVMLWNNSKENILKKCYELKVFI